MSTKRISTDASNDEQTNEDSDSILHQKDNAKRAKLTPLSQIQLQDLPIQILERILVKAVVVEVLGMKLVKRVWKDKADLVISRLKTVCLHWNSILTTNEFTTKVHRILDGTAQEIRLRTLYRLWVNLVVLKVTTMKDELFMLFTQDGQNKINVYDVNDWEEVKDVIALPGISPSDIEGCSVSDCVYALCKNVDETSASVLRITKDEEQRLNVQPWISNLRYPAATIFVSATGVLSVPNGAEPDSVSIYDANGSLVFEC